MNCDRCDNEATVHEITVVGGVQHEKHLCEQCAAEEGVVIGAGGSVTELLGKLAEGLPPGTAIEITHASPKCPSCGLTFAKFRHSGLLGCASCYAAFEDRLGPLLERAHEGAAQHVGKLPKRALAATRLSPTGESAPDILGDAEQHAQRAQLLRKKLEEAVAAEQYERAAKLRDELNQLETEKLSPGAEPAP